jgi:hypothetical protein
MVVMVDDNRIHDDTIADADIKITTNCQNQSFLHPFSLLFTELLQSYLSV